MAESPRYSLANEFDLPAFVEMRQVQRVADLCRVVRSTQTLGMLAGLPGVGKTWAVQHVAQHEPEPDDFRNSPVLYTAVDLKTSTRGFLINLLNCLGPDYRAPIGDMVRLVCCWIHRRLTELFIVDNAERLDAGSWEAIADIHERTRCAFLFVGPPELPHNLKNRRIHNSLSMSIEMLPLTYDELHNFILRWQQIRKRKCAKELGGRRYFFPMVQDEETEIVKEMYRVTMGNMRRIFQFIEQTERVAEVNGHYWVQIETAQAVAALMAGGRL